MNHDYAHCADYVKGKCPLSCFRAELVEDYKRLEASREWVRPVSWMNLKDTDSCPMKTEKRKNRLDDYLICPYCDAVQTKHEPECEDTKAYIFCQKCGRRFGYDVSVIHSYNVWLEDVADEMRC